MAWVAPTGLGIYDAFVRTTIDINDAVLRELRELAASTGRPLRAVVEETLRRGLSSRQRSSRRRARVAIETSSVGIKLGFRGVSMNQLYDQIEAEDRSGSA